MNRYLSMDQESKNRQYLLDFLGLLSEMVVTTMFPYRVPMVVRAWFCPPRSYDLFVDLFNVVRHAADGIVELMGLTTVI